MEVDLKVLWGNCSEIFYRYTRNILEYAFRNDNFRNRIADQLPFMGSLFQISDSPCVWEWLLETQCAYFFSASKKSQSISMV